MADTARGWGVVAHRARPVRWAALALIVTGALVLGTVTVLRLVQPGVVAGPLWVPAAGAAPPPVPAVAPTGTPTRLVIPAIGVDTPLQSLGLDAHGQLLPPAGYDEAGWYALGPAPGDQGPAVLAGHVDSKAGPAVFYRLRDLRPGAPVRVLRGGRWLDFQVVGTERYAKASFPTARVYGPTPDAQLRLITCGGVFERGTYRDNLVVYAIAG